MKEGIRGLVNASGLMTASGGIGYHLAAIRFSPRLWRPFRENLSRELGRRIRSPEEADLVLVGPSGGYCLDPEFFSRFRSLIAVDIDPLAGILLRRRLGRARFVRGDFFRRLENRGWDLGRAVSELGAEKDPVVLFSNVLGQLGFLHGERRMAEIGRGLSTAFRGRVPWVSFHDRFSIASSTAPGSKLEFPERPPSGELARAWGVGGEIEEHEIGEWVEAARGPFGYLDWRLEPRRTQLIEVCSREA